eukprot:11427902-Ditylum_brightwellii.AAC.1
MINFIKDTSAFYDDSIGKNEEVDAPAEFFDSGTAESGKKILAKFQAMFYSSDITKADEKYLSVMELLELGQEEGDRRSSSFARKNKSLQQQ